MLNFLIYPLLDQLAELIDAPALEVNARFRRFQALPADVKLQLLRLHVRQLLILDQVVDLSERMLHLPNVIREERLESFLVGGDQLLLDVLRVGQSIAGKGAPVDTSVIFRSSLSIFFPCSLF